ncbi:RICIN domain-containing protein [Streptomyces niveus]|uniref:RICIN domain-containing protein n=1 Tax=Streptomyces niveus TaxID=193462 RepID=UPI00342CADBF
MRRAPHTLHRTVVRKAVVALSVLTLGGSLGLTSSGTAQAADPTAQVWISTADGSRKLASDGQITFNSTPQAIDINVNPGQREQQFTGAGASVTGAAGHLINQLPAAQKNALMTSLFSAQGDGIGINYLRQPLGGTDFNQGAAYTYEDNQGDFNLGRDHEAIIPVLKQAVSINPGIRFMGSPWTPPAWMKTNNSLNGGSLRTDRYQNYADYLVKAIQGYQQQGLKLTDLTVQNEPEFATSYPSMSMTASEQAAFFKVLDRTLTAANLPTNLLAYDHNWDHPNFPLQVFAETPGMNRVIGAAFHCYGGQPTSQSQIRQAGKRVFFTECSGTDSDNPAGTFADTLKWHAENLVVANMRNGGETTIMWNLALNQNGGPHQGHCTTRCNGVVEINGNTVTRNAEYYVLGHLTKFVKPGATRIGSTSQGAGGVQNVVWHNPDGSKAAYVVNGAGAARTFSVTDAGRSATYTLPAGAVATLVWTGADTGNPGDGSIDPAKWYQVVNSGSNACLDATGWGTADGTGLQQWACSVPAANNQTWQFRPTSNGYYQVVNRHAGKVWDIDGGVGATADGARAHLWSYTGATNQQWQSQRIGTTDRYRFAARHSNKCLTVSGGTGNGATLTQQPCTEAANQTFRLAAQP